MNPKEKETKLLREMDIFGVSTARTVASAGDIVEIAAFLHHTQFLPVFPKTDGLLPGAVYVLTSFNFF